MYHDDSFARCSRRLSTCSRLWSAAFAALCCALCAFLQQLHLTPAAFCSPQQVLCKRSWKEVGVQFVSMVHQLSVASTTPVACCVCTLLLCKQCCDSSQPRWLIAIANRIVLQWMGPLWVHAFISLTFRVKALTLAAFLCAGVVLQTHVLQRCCGLRHAMQHQTIQ